MVFNESPGYSVTLTSSTYNGRKILIVRWLLVPFGSAQGRRIQAGPPSVPLCIRSHGVNRKHTMSRTEERATAVT